MWQDVGEIRCAQKGRGQCNPHPPFTPSLHSSLPSPPTHVAFVCHLKDVGFPKQLGVDGGCETLGFGDILKISAIKDYGRAVVWNVAGGENDNCGFARGAKGKAPFHSKLAASMRYCTSPKMHQAFT